MKKVLLSGLSLLASSVPLAAAPHVVGYERFHADAPAAEGGAVLFSELGCANCHGGSPVAVPRRGPKLVDLDRRIDREWLADFLRDPGSAHAGSAMPAMLRGIPEEGVGEILAYLGSLRTKAKFPVGRHANAERGSALYHEKGCVACHAPTPDFHPPHGGGASQASPFAVSHPELGRKTSLEALQRFLQAPSDYRPDGRMPHFVLEEQEAVDIAAHLLDFQGSDPREAGRVAPWGAAAPETIAAGKELVRRLRCASCHDLPGIKAPEMVALSGKPGGDRSCLGSDPAAGLPRYELAAGQRSSLQAFLTEGVPPGDPSGHLTLAAMNCYACHDRDGRGGPVPETHPFFVGDEALGDSGRLAPPLLGIGRKLQREWLEGVFAGSEGSRVRPYLKTRMPTYPGAAPVLAGWLEKIDRPEKTVPLVEHPGDLEAGRKLLGILGGVNCITCHTWDGKPSLGIQALDLASLDRRLRPEWFRSYLLDPAAYRPGTLMPPLWPGGKSTVPDVLGGDAERQIAAIWTFIREGEGLPEGFPDHGSGKFELVPTDRPLIQRTFFEGTGTRAILVGFPGGFNLAYDGDGARPSAMWRGAFFDAYHTWYSRAAPFEKPLGDHLVPFPGTGAESGRRFRGYRLDEAGNPTFLFVEGGREVSEWFSVRDGALVRRLSWSAGGAPAVTHPEGVSAQIRSGEGFLEITYTFE